MTENIPKESNSFKNLKLGTHIGAIYRNEEEQILTLISFFKAGFEQNQKGIYAYSDEKLKNKLLEEFKKNNIDINDLMQKGQFEVLASDDAYTKNEEFLPDEMYSLLDSIESYASTQKYAGVRAAGEMSWYLKGVKGSEQLLKYESELNNVYSKMKIIGLCLYDETKFEKEILLETIHTHQKMTIYGKLCDNNYYFSPNLYLDENRKSLPKDAYELVIEDITYSD
jgi:hypothetical protein